MQSTHVTPDPIDETLRAEHDQLARRLTIRRSIDHVRRGAYAAFACFVTSGLTVKFAWDRWGPLPKKIFRGPPLLFFGALALALVSLAIAARAFVLARREMRVEDRDFARLRELRTRLGLEP